MTNATEKKYRRIVALAADSIETLRSSDVYRVIEEADEQRCATRFADWLGAQRPELAIEIADCLDEVQGVVEAA